MKKIIFVSYLGCPGVALRQTQVNENFRTIRPHNRADKFITREKIITSFSYMGPNVNIFVFILGNTGEAYVESRGTKVS